MILLTFTFCLSMIGALTASAEPLKVVFAGFGRSGTNSLAAALQRLGYSTCHGRDISLNILGTHKSLAQAFINHDFDAIIGKTEELGYNATLEVHGIFWREIMERRPEAKYIFIIRDYDKWMQSMMTLYWSIVPATRYPLRFFPFFQRQVQFVTAVRAHNLNVPQKEAWIHTRKPFSLVAREKLRDAYDRYVDDARSVTSQNNNNTLLFDLRDGYPALCEFLEVNDCPQEDFPHLYPSEGVVMTGYVLRGIETAVLVLPPLVILILWMLLKRCSSRKRKMKQT